MLRVKTGIRSRRHASWCVFCLTLLLAVAVAPPATSDILVTRDGARVETKGGWEVDGRRVIFTMPNGTLSAMRASEIDFEASEAASRQAEAAATATEEPAAEPEPRPEPVLVLTNKDIPRGEVPDPDAKGTPEVLPSVADREPVQVINWKRFDSEEGIELRGTVRNTGSSVAANVSVRATVKDEEGEAIATGNAFLGNASLVSGRSTSFRIVLPDIDDFAGNPEFVVSSSRLTVGGAARPRSAAGNADDGDDDTGAGADDETDDETEVSSGEESSEDDIKP